MSKKQKILLIDNYDSFTYNLRHYLEYSGECMVDVIRNDALFYGQLNKYDAFVISPGPGLPKESGMLMDFISDIYSTKKILGVCLGHQAIAEFFGATLVQSSEVFHGIATKVEVESEHFLFQGIPKSFLVGRYHSWYVQDDSLPDCLRVTSRDEQKLIMSVSHQSLSICSVQFHPESILTEHGLQIIQNWISS